MWPVHICLEYQQTAFSDRKSDVTVSHWHMPGVGTLVFEYARQSEWRWAAILFLQK